MSYTSIPWVLIQNFVFDVFCRYGVPEEDAVVCADVLLESDRRGIESHGLNRLKSTYLDRIRDGIQYPVTNFEVLRDSGATAVIDGHDGMGQVIGARSMRLAIDKAKKFGLGMTVVRNSTHYGIAGYFASMATESGCIGITGTNARPTTAPTFGVENMMGTNPMTFGIPTDEPFDFMLDCATSIIQTGKVEVLAREGLPLPEGTVVDRDGAVMKDSREALAALMSGGAALAALGGVGEELGGYKGYGFATVVEILSAALQDGNFLKDISRVDAKGEPRPYHLGHFFIAINVEAFIPLETFKRTAGEILRTLRNSKKAPGQKRIYTAGEKEYLARLERKDTGVPVGKGVQDELIQIRDELGLDQYKFPFE